MEARIQAEREQQSTFVLITSDRTCDAQQALLAYKAQDQDEQGFRWAKSPVHLTAFFLEKPTRVTGLGYVLLLAWQFARFMRAIVREAMIDQPVLELPDHRKIERPSERVILGLCGWNAGRTRRQNGINGLMWNRMSGAS